MGQTNREDFGDDSLHAGLESESDLWSGGFA